MYGINIEKFKTYVAKAGADILEPTNQYELLRFMSREGIGIVYEGKRGITFTGAALTAYQFFDNGKQYVASKNYQRWERPTVVAALLERDGGDCFYCGKEMADDITVEHILAKAHGGPDSEENLCLAHERCNKDMGSLSVVEKIKAVLLMRSVL